MNQRDPVTVSLHHAYHVVKAGRRVSCGKDAMVMVVVVVVAAVVVVVVVVVPPSHFVIGTPRQPHGSA